MAFKSNVLAISKMSHFIYTGSVIMSTYVISTESIDLIKVTSCLVPSVDGLDLFKISIDISDINVDTEWST